MRFLTLIRTWMINILLAGAALFFGYQTFEVWSVNGGGDVNKSVRKPPKPHGVTRVVYHRLPRYGTYEVVARKNLFSSDRMENLPEKPPAPSPVIPSKPLDSRFALFGIVIKSDEKKALVSNLNKKTADEKSVIWVKVGESIGDMTISEIASGQITVTRAGSAHTILLSEQGDHGRRPAVRRKAKPDETAPRNVTRPKGSGLAEKGSKP